LFNIDGVALINLAFKVYFVLNFKVYSMSAIGFASRPTPGVDAAAGAASAIASSASSVAPSAAFGAPPDLPTLAQASGHQPIIKLPPRRPPPSMRALFLERELTVFERVTERLVHRAARVKVHEAIKAVLLTASAVPVANLASKWLAGVPISWGSDVWPLLKTAAVIGGAAAYMVRQLNAIHSGAAFIDSDSDSDSEDEPAPIQNPYAFSNADVIPKFLLPNWAKPFIGRDGKNHTEQVRAFLDTVIQLKYATNGDDDKAWTHPGLHVNHAMQGFIPGLNIVAEHTNGHIYEDLADIAGNVNSENRMEAARALHGDEIIGGRIGTLFIRTFNGYTVDALKAHHLQDYRENAIDIAGCERLKPDRHFSDICDKLLAQLSPQNIGPEGEFIFQDPSAVHFFEATAAKAILDLRENRSSYDINPKPLSKRAQKIGLLLSDREYWCLYSSGYIMKPSEDSTPDMVQRFHQALLDLTGHASAPQRLAAANTLLQLENSKRPLISDALEQILVEQAVDELKVQGLEKYSKSDFVKKIACNQLQDSYFKWEKYFSGPGSPGLKAELLALLSPVNFSQSGGVVNTNPLVINAIAQISAAVVVEVRSKIESSRVKLTQLFERAQEFGIGLMGQGRVFSTPVSVLVQQVFESACDESKFEEIHQSLENMMTATSHQSRVRLINNFLEALRFLPNIFSSLNNYIDGLHNKVVDAIGLAYSRQQLSSDSHESDQTLDNSSQHLPFSNIGEYQGVLALSRELCEPTLVEVQHVFSERGAITGMRSPYGQRQIRLTKLLLQLTDTNPPSDDPDDVLDQLILDYRAGLRALVN
jgi:hypothetical protein